MHRIQSIEKDRHNIAIRTTESTLSPTTTGRGASSEQAVLLSDGTAALETGISRAIVTQLAYGRVHTTALGNIVYHSLSSRINPQIDCWVDNVPPAYSKCKYI